MKIAPSVLAVWDKYPGGGVAAYKAVGEAVERLYRMGADWIHVDVMDGVFVPARTFGVEILEQIVPYVERAAIDVHLMVEKPEKVVGDYVRGGAGRVVFHPTACGDIGGALREIRAGGAIAGLALDVDEGVELLAPWVGLVEQVLIMTVKAGAGGQSFRPEMLAKVKAVRELVGPEVCIVVDGGVNLATVGACRAAGVDAVVAGSAVIGSEDWAGAIVWLRG